MESGTGKDLHLSHKCNSIIVLRGLYLLDILILLQYNKIKELGKQ